MKLQDNVIKDAEFAEIMRDFESRIYDWAFIAKMFDKATEMMNSDIKDKVSLRKLLYKIGDSIFGMHWQYPKEDVRYDLRFPGNHDFNVIIGRYFDDDLLGRYSEDVLPFYIKWLYEMKVYVESEGSVYPRYVPEIRWAKMPDGKRFIVNDTVLLTRKDVSGVEGFEECKFPFYYFLPNKDMRYGSLEDMEKLFKKELGDRWENAFKRYRIHEYPIHQEIEHQVERYKNLSKTVVI